MLIARVIADRAALSASLAHVIDALAEQGLVSRLDVGPGGVDEIVSEAADVSDWPRFRATLEAHLPRADVLITDHVPLVPGLFVSDMDSTMIGQECIDELADYAGVKPQVAAITERAMQGELDFVAALKERVALLKGLEVGVLAQCLAERVRPNPGAKTLVGTLRHHGATCLLVSGGFTAFAGPVGAMLGFDEVRANVLAQADGLLTGVVEGAIVDSHAKFAALEEWEAELAIARDMTMAIGDGANDRPMVEAAGWGIAYHAKPALAAAADARIEHHGLDALLWGMGLPRSAWVES